VDGAFRSPGERTLVGDHPTIVKLRALVERVAATDATVLITGESGSGKEVVAHAIHSLSARTRRNFVPVNCAAIPHELLESEMLAMNAVPLPGQRLRDTGFSPPPTVDDLS
jgi:transcriptional regulator with PAS, ATPase and Fis domain